MRLFNPRGGPLPRLALAAIAVGLFLVGYYWGNQYQRRDSASPVIEAVLVRPPHPLPDFELQDAAGRSFTTERLAGRWTLLAFGRPSREPGRAALERMVEAHNHLAGDPELQARLLLLLVARRQDPASDAGPWSQALRFLSGAPEEIQDLRAALGMPEQATDATSVSGNPCYLIGPTGRLSALFPDAQAPASIASDLAAIAARESAHD